MSGGRGGAKAIEQMDRDELIDELRRLRASSDPQGSEQAFELHVQREELAAQYDALCEAERALEASRDRYIDLYDSAPVAYFTLDARCMLIELNLTAATLLELDRAHALHTPFIVFVDPPDRREFFAHIGRCRRSSGEVITELRLRMRSGRVVPVLLGSSPAVSEGGRVFRSVAMDLTANKLAEEARLQVLEEEQRNQAREESLRAAAAAKDRFLATLSHELRTPLTPILVMVTALEARGEVPGEMRPLFQMIRRNLELEVNLISDLLDVTRIAKGKLRLSLTTVDLHALAREVMTMYEHDAGAAGVTVQAELEAESHHVTGDRVRLQQVLWNLLGNAVRYTPPGGSVTVRSEDAGPHTIRLTVMDTGVGLEEQDLERIFEPFLQAQGDRGHQGLGLGLPICRGLIEAHGGVVRASSGGRGRGAAFALELDTAHADTTAVELGAVETPGPSEPPALPSEPLAASMTRAKAKKILLVEDHADTAEALQYLLSSEGFEIELADSVKTALASSRNDVDLVISDLGLPDGSGLDVMRMLNAKRPMKGIALSGYGADDEVHQARDAGFAGHLTKPVDFARLLEMIRLVTAA